MRYGIGMNDAFSIARSGMAAASLRLNVSASNVANAMTDGPLPTATSSNSGAPAAYAALRVDQVELSGGGTAAKVGTVSPAYTPSYDPDAPYADANGMVAAPNVDLTSEIVQQIVARYEFAANAKVMRAADEMTKILLDVTA